jgi:hypothetical protein
VWVQVASQGFAGRRASDKWPASLALQTGVVWLPAKMLTTTSIIVLEMLQQILQSQPLPLPGLQCVLKCSALSN